MHDWLARFSSLSIAVVCGILACNPAHARSKAQNEAGAQIILKALNTSGLSINQVISQVVVGLRTQQRLCPSSLWDGPVEECLRGNDDNDYEGELQSYVDYAVKQGELDPVEGESLKVAFTTIASVSNASLTGITFSNAPLLKVSGSGITLPPILPYRQNKADFAALRAAKGQQSVLPAAIAAQMAKQFPRQMQGVGSVTPEQYLAAQMGRLSLNELSGLMVTAADFMSRPDAKVMLYPPNYSVESAQLKQDQEQEVALAEEVAATADPKQRATLQAQLAALESQTSVIAQKDQVDTLTQQRAVLNQQLMTDVAALANPGITDDDRLNLGGELQATLTQINDADQKLGDLIRTENLAPEDVQRLAINSLHADFQGLIQQAPFNQMQLVTADALLAAWVSGDISTTAMTTLCQFPGLKESHPNIWTEALSIGWDIAKPALMVFPTTSYIAIGISVLLDIQQTAQINKEVPSDETHLIPLQPN